MPARAAAPIPLIHISDLYHPHEDPDDHFDLAFLYCDPGIDLKAVILDRATHPGTPLGDGLPVRQLNHLFSRSVPYATGASGGLTSLTDSRAGDPSQGGIDLILDVLTNATDRVAITSVGSCRDLAAAYNRDSALFIAKAGPVYVFAGDGAEGSDLEWNVGLDTRAYVRLMQANALDIRWAPCFDGNTWHDNPPHRDSWWENTADLYVHASDGLKQYNSYMGANCDPTVVDPIAYLSQPVTNWGSTRNMWGAAAFTAVSGRTIVRETSSGNYSSVAAGQPVPAGRTAETLFAWGNVEVNIGTDGVTQSGHSATSKSAAQLHIAETVNYAKAMSDVTAHMYGYSRNVTGAAPATPASPRSVLRCTAKAALSPRGLRLLAGSDLFDLRGRLLGPSRMAGGLRPDTAPAR